MKLLILAIDCDTTRILYHELAKHFGDIHVILENPQNRWSLLKSRFKKLGGRATLGQFLFIVLYKVVLVRRARARIAEICESFSLLPIHDGVVSRVETLNSPEAAALVQKVNPDVIVVNGTRILKELILKSSAAPFINTHLGIVPLYRGVHGGYWSLAQNDAKNFGATVHRVDLGVDTGAPLVQTRGTPPGPRDSVATYPYLQFVAVLPALIQLLKKDPKNWASLNPPSGESRQWYHPTLGEYLRHARRGIR